MIVYITYTLSLSHISELLEPIPADPELIASQSQGRYKDKQLFTSTSTPSLSANLSHTAHTHVRRVYHYTISNIIIIMIFITIIINYYDIFIVKV